MGTAYAMRKKPDVAAEAPDSLTRIAENEIPTVPSTARLRTQLNLVRRTRKQLNSSESHDVLSDISRY